MFIKLRNIALSSCRNLKYLKRSLKPEYSIAASHRQHFLFTRLSSTTNFPSLNTVPKTMSLDKSLFVLPNDQPVVTLECSDAFGSLTNKEKLYAHYLSKACWFGGLIVLVQTSPEAPLIFVLLHKLYKSDSIETLRKTALEQLGFTPEEFQALLVYSCGILTNMGNYKGFGDVKFIPDLPLEKLEALIKASRAYQAEPSLIQKLWNNCSVPMYELTEHTKQLGLGDKGITTYFSSNCTTEDSDVINDFFKSKAVEGYNNRLFKRSNLTDGKCNYEVRLASILSPTDEENSSILGSHEHQGHRIEITRGDYHNLLALVNENLEKAKEHALNDREKQMVDEYIKSFKTGSLDAHKDGSRHWILNKGPVIETYIGFIETYRDPVGSRGEFEGFVAMVNKKMSAKFTELVSRAEEFIPRLPWPESLEKDKFLRPDFTSLDVLSFSGSGIPAGINIPNYDEIRQSEGFKNVSLGNVIPASFKDTKILYLSPEDQELLKKHIVASFEVQVGLHELLGHGTGKLLYKKNDGFNFDVATTRNPLTGEPITSWYEEGDTYDSKFTTMGSSYEECRAECVGIYLCTIPQVLKVFGLEGEEAQDVLYVNWMSMARSGLRGLEMYQKDKKMWGQAHSQARFVILRVLQEADPELVRIVKTTGEDGEPDIMFSFDRSKIMSVGMKAIGDFLLKLQTYKSLADIKSAKEMYDRYSTVEGEFLEFLDIVVARRQPRKMFVQCNTDIDADGSVVLKTYESNHEGLIQSFLERFDERVDTALYDLWNKDRDFFNC